MSTGGTQRLRLKSAGDGEAGRVAVIGDAAQECPSDTRVDPTWPRRPPSGDAGACQIAHAASFRLSGASHVTGASHRFQFRNAKLKFKEVKYSRVHSQ